MYTVTSKYVPEPGKTAPGEHYTVEDPDKGESLFRKIHFYRTPRGHEVAEDNIGMRLQADGGLFRSVKAAVEKYDADHPG